MLLMRTMPNSDLGSFRRSFESSFTGATWSDYVTGILGRSTRPRLAGSIRLEMKRRRCSIAHVPVEGAEGAGMR